MDIQIITDTNVEQLQFDIRGAVRQISKSENLEAACLIAEQYFLARRLQLHGVLFCDRKNHENVVRPFRNAPEKLANIANKIRKRGISPLASEALRLLHPFEIDEIDRSRYSDFLSTRFLDELLHLNSGSILVVPVILGRGLGMFTVGAIDTILSSKDKIWIIDSVCQITVAIISRFPVVTTFFESKRLSALEAKALFLNSNGYADIEIGNFLNLSEIAIGSIMKSAGKKLNAKNRSQTIARALAFGEISNMQFRNHICCCENDESKY